MDLEGSTLSEISQKEKDTYHMISLLWILKNKIIEQTKQKYTHRYREYTDGCQMRGGSERMDEKGEGIKKYQLAVTKQSQGCKAQHREYRQCYCNNCLVPGGY